ncbi:high mobility group box domain-containing protein [Sparassis latifolia]|uniref:HMG box domain-containing protein n=1 Tax=Sparassis crispa TaxID=139825 RepID=A0A401GAB2_9APHY|nr:predicted protein [Sparassis crispa]GBE79087.1 predicted protein [Sparassis crispa]
MANLPEGLAQFEYQKMQLIGSLGAVAETMRNCAAIADQFAQMVTHVPYSSAAIQPHPNGFVMAPPPTTPTLAGSKRKSRVVTEESEKKKKIPRDPNAPKRPASSYIFFQNEVRQELKEKNPDLPNNALLGIISKLWTEMPKEQKEAYEIRQRVAKDEWMIKKTEYLKANSERSATTPNVTPATTAAPAALVAVASPVQETHAPVVTSSDDSSEDESSDDSSEDEDEVKPPPPKKSKKDAAATPIATPVAFPVATPAKVEQLVKEKKHKKPKA